MGKPMNKFNPERQRTRFSKAFKLEAARMIERPKRELKQVTEERARQGTDDHRPA